MLRHRSPARTFLSAATLAVVLAAGGSLAGCSAASGDAPTTSPTASTSDAAVVAPAHADGYGLPAGDGLARIELWTDLSCPYCRQLELATGDLIADAVAAGTATLVIHPLNFVSTKHGDDTDWSTRAASALAAVSDAGENDRLPAFYALLQEHQTLADGTSHPTDDDIVALAQQAGVTSDISDAVASRRFGPWVSASNQHWLGATIDGTSQVVSGVPILVVNGTVIDLSADDLTGRLQAAIDAAQN